MLVRCHWMLSSIDEKRMVIVCSPVWDASPVTEDGSQEASGYRLGIRWIRDTIERVYQV